LQYGIIYQFKLRISVHSTGLKLLYAKLIGFSIFFNCKCIFILMACVCLFVLGLPLIVDEY